VFFSHSIGKGSDEEVYQCVLLINTLSVRVRNNLSVYRFEWNLLHTFYNCIRHIVHFPFASTHCTSGSRRLFVHCLDRYFCSSLFHSVFIKFTIFSFFLYIANLACNSADDVDGRHWLVRLMVMSIYRVTTNRPRSLSLSVGLFLLVLLLLHLLFIGLFTMCVRLI